MESVALEDESPWFGVVSMEVQEAGDGDVFGSSQCDRPEIGRLCINSPGWAAYSSRWSWLIQGTAEGCQPDTLIGD